MHRSHVILDAAPQHEQTSELTRIKRIWGGGSGSKPESVGLIVVT
jgi:hypothetical protein